MGRAPEETETIVQLRSAPVSELVAHMLTESDNTYAELLTKEIGLVASGRGRPATASPPPRRWPSNSARGRRRWPRETVRGCPT